MASEWALRSASGSGWSVARAGRQQRAPASAPTSRSIEVRSAGPSSLILGSVSACIGRDRIDIEVNARRSPMEASALALLGRARRAPRDGARLRRQGIAPPRRRVGGGRGLPGQRVPAHGRARPARIALPGGVRRAGRRLLQRDRPCRGDGSLRLGRRRHGDQRPHRDGDAPILKWGTEDAEAALPRAGDPRREDRRARHHRARCRQRRRQHSDPRRARRRPLADQRQQALHHQRRALRLHPAGRAHRHAGRTARTGSRSSSSTRTSPASPSRAS